MPLSYFRRPLALALWAYILFLAFLHHVGYFRTEFPDCWLRFLEAPRVELRGRIVSSVQETRFGRKTWIDVEEIRDPGARVTGRARVQAFFRSGAREEDLCPGTEVVMEGRLRRPRPPRKPGEFDELSFLSDQGVAGVFQARSWSAPSPPAAPRGWAAAPRGEGARLPGWAAAVSWRPACWAERAHRSIHLALARDYPPPIAGVLEGMLLGYKGPLEPGVNRTVQDAGVMHLLVPSGAKVVFLMMSLVWLAGRLRMGPVGSWSLLILVGGFYVLVVGAGPPYMRAYLCFLIARSAFLWGREPTAFQALVLSAAAILALRPRELFSAGFQMSYAAVLGLLIAMPRWRFGAGRPRWVRIMLRAALVSAAVQLMLAPMLARMFGRVSLAGLVANAILVPASGAFMGLGFIVWGLSLLPASWPAVPFVVALGLMTRAFLWICGLFASLPFAAVDCPPMGAARTAAYYLAVFGVLVWPQRSAACKFWLAAAVLSVATAGAAWARVHSGLGGGILYTTVSFLG